MTALGQKRRFGRERAMSGLAPTTVVLNVATIFAYGPQAEVLQPAFYREARRSLSDFFDDVQRPCRLFR